MIKCKNACFRHAKPKIANDKKLRRNIIGIKKGRRPTYLKYSGETKTLK
jgi:hypothetical protein